MPQTSNENEASTMLRAGSIAGNPQDASTLLTTGSIAGNPQLSLIKRAQTSAAQVISSCKHLKLEMTFRVSF